MIFYAYFFCCLSQNNYLCALIFSHLLNMQSHPTWVRGLKQYYQHHDLSNVKSHPTWVRGLKRQGNLGGHLGNGVAPYVGAWIETTEYLCRQAGHLVAPYVGAWIETYDSRDFFQLI